eukprot:jgi/Bigna1/86496/estExt_fgenesh1_pg.C_110034
MRSLPFLCLLVIRRFALGDDTKIYKNDTCKAQPSLCNPPHGRCQFHEQVGNYVCICGCGMRGENCTVPIFPACDMTTSNADSIYTCAFSVGAMELVKRTKTPRLSPVKLAATQNASAIQVSMADIVKKTIGLATIAQLISDDGVAKAKYYHASKRVAHGNCINSTEGFQCSCKYSNVYNLQTISLEAGFTAESNCRGTESDPESSTWGWWKVGLIIFGIIAASVVLERVWTCGKKTITKMQGREGFRPVYNDDDADFDDEVLDANMPSGTTGGGFTEVEIGPISHQIEDLDDEK